MRSVILVSVEPLYEKKNLLIRPEIIVLFYPFGIWHDNDFLNDTRLRFFVTHQMRMNGFRCAAAIASGLLLWISFPPHAQSESAYLALVPLFILIRTSTPKQAFAWAWLSGMIFWCATLSWFPAIIKNGGPWPLVFLGQFALSAWCALYLGLFAFTSARVWKWAGASGSWRRIVAVILIDPLLWAGTEYLRATVLSGFAWNFLGVSQVKNIPLIQIASVFGVYGVSALLVLANGAITSMVWRAVEPFIARLRQEPLCVSSLSCRLLRSAESVLPIALVLVCWVWGLSRERSWQPENDKHLEWRIALIQPNGPCVFSDDAELRRQQRELLLEQTRLAGIANPDLVLWPETAAPGVLPLQKTYAFIKEGIEAAHAPLLTGSTEAKKIRETGDERKDFLYYNSAWLFAADGDAISAYRKQHLVPFGEYIPLDKKIASLQRLAPTGISCTPGETSGVMSLTRANGDTLKLGPLICFEDTIPDLSRRAIRDGARILALVTNDAWFNGSIEPVQHLHQAVFRAVENGVPMVRCANSGISCVVSPVGKVTMLESDGAVADFHGFMVNAVNVPTTPFPSPYTRYGDWLLAIPGMFIAIWLLLIHKRPRIPFFRRS